MRGVVNYSDKLVCNLCLWSDNKYLFCLTLPRDARAVESSKRAAGKVFAKVRGLEKFCQKSQAPPSHPPPQC